jgi:hypothetical protein
VNRSTAHHALAERLEGTGRHHLPVALRIRAGVRRHPTFDGKAGVANRRSKRQRSHEPGVRDTRQRPHAIEKPLISRNHLLRRRVGCRRQRDAHREQVARIESELDALEHVDTADHQSGTGDEHNRHRGLGNHQ